MAINWYLYNALFWFCMLCSYQVKGQVKYEREYRVKAESVPTKALDFIDELKAEHGKVKWYHEIGYHRESFEAKTKIHKQKYSIEFDTTGRIEDVEVDIDFNDIDYSVRDLICTKFSQEYDKYKIEKVQVQYTGDERKLIDAILINEFKKPIKVQYEIVVKVKRDGLFEEYEYLFDGSGVHISHALIVQRNQDNIEY